ncbi:2-oxoglutarate dehydrogenase E1 component [Ketobacter alkanivorans]|uniref:2-oxoglutarate dehydrogenase E1 component n=1 Tax=Ketobacter alkanivorans TaxID=1917421 RepID=A0A2K9LKH7_9GAMM|nr:2-oxoglutarate dehydrogenase E1 component [Ketobacter alkanivorans]AUM11264.1 2-oxoglutarate dehydrogenase E1 component [Ketobacter alkanivorans]MCP5015947.1 2-oxoglutarate dehydrogenase E1 component [Ketobacter sp.]
MDDSLMYRQWSTSHLSGSNATYVEELYEAYLKDPNSVPEQWRDNFDKLPRVNGTESDVPHSTIREHFLYLAKNKNRVQPLSVSSVSSEHEKKQVKVLQLITGYRVRGHQKAKLDPLNIMERESVPDLELTHHGLSGADLDTTFQTGNVFLGREEATLREIVDALEKTYCTSIGVEYMHIVDTAEKRWIQQRMESVRSHPNYSADVKTHLLERLIAAEGLERMLATKYPGTKRFGLEGGESLIPCLDEIVQRAGSYGAKELVIGMAHRGRLNVLVNILGKNPAELFSEFEGLKKNEVGSGDVKYHQGFSSNVMTPGGELHLALAFNPSHLEIVSPVVEGSVRARQDRRKDKKGDKVVPVLIHGDAAFAGQGVVMETFQMSQTRGYKTGGTLHIIVNNQVGFTTSNRHDARSTEYCTDIAKMVQAPIFHVNGDDPEAVLFVTQMAIDFRQQFKKDVVIDLICYRARGHNEADEPSITQPMMYSVIREKKNPREIYSNKLVEQGAFEEQRIATMMDDYRSALDNGQHVVKSLVKKPNTELFVDWAPYIGHDYEAYYDTSVDVKVIHDLAQKLSLVPDGFAVQRQVSKIREDRLKMAAGALSIDWGFAETMAYATLLDQGFPVRLTGQDVGRGTFSHRHAVMHNQKEPGIHVPLKTIPAKGIRFDLYDSLLSEEAVLAFEYGYSTTSPGGLVIWEAQFGDFANGAQVVIDQFISSGEHKWMRLCGLTMLLPHGYEGQGPEHSSARLERFLQLCAEHNMQVCVPSTPAQVYHMLRRQAIRPLRKPLIVMSPKSLLRHKLAKSSLDELANGHFKVVLDDAWEHDPKQIERVILCSGKVYYDLFEYRAHHDIKNTLILRVEQLYPFPEQEMLAMLKPYSKIKHAVWCQEEPMNQGAWYCSQHHMRHVFHTISPNLLLQYAGRGGSAAPAAGYMSLHLEEQNRLVETAFNI